MKKELALVFACTLVVGLAILKDVLMFSASPALIVGAAACYLHEKHGGANKTDWMASIDAELSKHMRWNGKPIAKEYLLIAACTAIVLFALMKDIVMFSAAFPALLGLGCYQWYLRSGQSSIVSDASVDGWEIDMGAGKQKSAKKSASNKTSGKGSTKLEGQGLLSKLQAKLRGSSSENQSDANRSQIDSSVALEEDESCTVDMTVISRPKGGDFRDGKGRLFLPEANTRRQQVGKWDRKGRKRHRNSNSSRAGGSSSSSSSSSSRSTIGGRVGAGLAVPKPLHDLVASAGPRRKGGSIRESGWAGAEQVGALPIEAAAPAPRVYTGRRKKPTKTIRRVQQGACPPVVK